MVRGSIVLMRVVWYRNLYKLLGITIIDECNRYVVLEEGGKDERTLTTSWGKTMLWHQRLAHIGEKGLWALQGKGMVAGMTDCTLDLDFYEHYIYGKQNRIRFASGATRAKGILELIQWWCVWTCSCSIIRKIHVLCLIYRWFLKEHMDLFYSKEIWSIC